MPSGFQANRVKVMDEESAKGHARRSTRYRARIATPADPCEATYSNPYVGRENGLISSLRPVPRNAAGNISR